MTTRSRSDVVEVHFYAIASKKFVEKLEDIVCMRFALQEYNGFSQLWKTNYMPYALLLITFLYPHLFYSYASYATKCPS